MQVMAIKQNVQCTGNEISYQHLYGHFTCVLPRDRLILQPINKSDCVINCFSCSTSWFNSPNSKRRYSIMPVFVQHQYIQSVTHSFSTHVRILRVPVQYVLTHHQFLFISQAKKAVWFTTITFHSKKFQVFDAVEKVFLNTKLQSSW